MKPITEVSNKEYYKDIHFLYDIIARMKGKEEMKRFLKDMLTTSELRMFKRRWHIACALESGMPIREAAKTTKTSTSTVLKVLEKLREGNGGLRVALERTIRDRRKRKTFHQGIPATFGGYHYFKNE